MAQTNAEWLAERLQFIRSLKSPNDQQKMLLMLSDKADKTADDDKKLAVLIKAEKAADKAQQAQAEFKKLMQAEKRAERKARDHELYNSAGLMIVAGLVDTKTGKPTMSKAKLVGALASLAQVPPDHHKWGEWEKTGTKLLQNGSKTSAKPEPTNTAKPEDTKPTEPTAFFGGASDMNKLVGD